ncbi:MAG: hypothetical protein ACK5WR_10740, partial [Planctomycetaceae bacterium]
AAQPAQGLLLGYAWRTSDYPWLNIWRFRDGTKRLARGLEFGTTGIHRPPAELLKQGGQRFGRPTFAYLEPDETVTREFLMFLVEIPADFAGVEVVEVSPRGIRVRERLGAKGREIDLRSSDRVPSRGRSEKDVPSTNGPSTNASLHRRALKTTGFSKFVENDAISGKAD